MSKIKNFLFATFLCWGCMTSIAQQVITLSSPSESLVAKMKLEHKKIYYSVNFQDRCILKEMPLTMTFDNGRVLGEDLKSLKCKTTLKAEIFQPVIAVRNKSARVVYNESVIKGEKYDIVFRLYDDAVAYRFVTKMGNRPVKVLGEEVIYNFVKDYHLLFPKEKSIDNTAQECLFVDTTLEGIDNGDYCSHPLVARDSCLNVLITEVDLEDYPGIYYCKKGKQKISGIFPRFRNDKVIDNADGKYSKDCLANTTGNRTYPWRVMLVTDKDVQLINSNTLYALAAPSRIDDTSWIKPGKVSWDWWNGFTFDHVDFKTGANTSTYKKYVDFASKYGLEYIMIDDGWYRNQNIFDVVPGLDLKEVVRYAQQKGVGVLLWAAWRILEKNKEAAFAHYHAMGIKGFKIDFMQRDDQWMINWYHSTAMLAAKYRLLIDYHGACKPTGLTRTYPNVLTSEGVHGAENHKWANTVTPSHNVTLTFTRMALGPMDYTPGAMRNAHCKDFVARWNSPMSQGTRCHQLGMYVVYESPLQMLSDSPSSYDKESAVMPFLSGVPTVWDESHALAGSIGEYVVMARRRGTQWWLGALNDGTERQIQLALDFLDTGKTYVLKLWEDGMNIKKNAEDFVVTERIVKRGDLVTLNLASGGGFAATLSDL